MADYQVGWVQPVTDCENGKTWHCRFHPTDWWHEVGCPHMKWTDEELKAAEESRLKWQREHLKP